MLRHMELLGAATAELDRFDGVVRGLRCGSLERLQVETRWHDPQVRRVGALAGAGVTREVEQLAVLGIQRHRLDAATVELRVDELEHGEGGALLHLSGALGAHRVSQRLRCLVTGQRLDRGHHPRNTAVAGQLESAGGLVQRRSGDGSLARGQGLERGVETAAHVFGDPGQRAHVPVGRRRDLRRCPRLNG